MKSLLRLRVFIRPYLNQVILNLALLLTITGLTLLIPELIQRVIDIGLGQRQYEVILIAGGLIFVIGTANALMSYGNTYLSEWIAAKVGFDLRNQLYNHIQHLSFSYHDHAQTGQLISRSIEDVRSIERFTGLGIVQLVKILLLLVGIIALMINKNALLAGIALLPMIPLVWITTRFGSRVGEMFYKVDHALGELSARLQENVTGVQVVRAFARENFEIQRFDKENRRLYQARVTLIGQWSRLMPSTYFLISLGTILILWFGGQMAIEGQLTLGEIVAFNSYLLMLAAPLQQITWLVNGAGEAAAGTRRVFEILDKEAEITSPPEAVSLPRIAGKVTFDQVCFAYAGERIPALKNINVTVKPNQIVALIGPTGSGKSSLVSLIPRFYEVSEGAVLIDDQDVRTLELNSLRTQIGIVLQTSLLFSDTLRNNIAYGKPGATEEEIRAAAVAAQVDEFVQNMPNGYDTIIGERGITLSGGQRQRVAIARALLMDPRILILDDSTSSVDTQTERLIQIALQSLMAGRTTFVIAHRLSTIRRADLILVLEEGEIVAQGTHTELLEKGGLYREIYELQLRDQEQLQERFDDFGAYPETKLPQQLHELDQE